MSATDIYTGLTQKYLKELLEYKDGEMFWKISRGPAKAGDLAGCLHKSTGYWHIKINRRAYKRSRLIWLYHHGYFPENEIDHINRVKTDDRIENLRHVSAQCNIRNQGMRCDNTSGITGVCWEKRHHKWQAQIRANGKTKNLGFFDDITDAIWARFQAEIKYNFPVCQGKSSPASEKAFEDLIK